MNEFKAGDKVKFRSDRSVPDTDLSSNGVYTVGAVVPLPSPHQFYVDRFYWDTPTYQWARNKTRLEVAGHGQVVFLDEVYSRDRGLLAYPADPGNLNRRSFSGYYFERA
jgi:hypothetical protein